MNYQHPETRKLLAGEYVLGTMTGLARTRFERLMECNRLIRNEVTAWEERFDHFNSVDEVLPPKRVWKKIKSKVQVQNINKGVLLNKVRWWRSLSVLAGVMVALLATFMFTTSDITPVKSNFISVVSTESAEPAWLIRIDTHTNTLSIEALRTMRAGDQNSYELWLLAGTKAPRSLGLLPENGIRKLLLNSDDVTSTAGLAVSIEPTGGSTTGAPTGPVVYQSKLYTAI